MSSAARTCERSRGADESRLRPHGACCKRRCRRSRSGIGGVCCGVIRRAAGRRTKGLSADSERTCLRASRSQQHRRHEAVGTSGVAASGIPEGADAFGISSGPRRRSFRAGCHPHMLELADERRPARRDRAGASRSPSTTPPSRRSLSGRRKSDRCKPPRWQAEQTE
jgi:hypothetical protein